ncbi:anaerobic carbon-monoxide dehydrogenase catalytic subunit [Methanotorris igneus]|uniref:Carbon monoxide dehydrogenase n=1 Tax=Methanotorris igneus (strain DSM 5666 / JCM 11834 / Kol 5) TaxID=880724 RepID=F6BAN0_METIK|nr:anaerobic carbon-monoxide dehydrogenase catalytic subunit [Methanotorris igneus]AEF95844.1 carbon-monoxide dehydrogenase, catalytic subunit [Methanotorris igneus Kol 5]
MSANDKINELTISQPTKEMLSIAKEKGIETTWDRLEKQEPHCGFGQLGICCRNCTMGPCRIDPFGGEPRKGVCGATADTIVARNFARMVAAGTAAHSDHGRGVALTLLEGAEGKAPYPIKDKEKLKSVATKLGIEIEGKSDEEIAKEIAKKALEDFSRQNEDTLNFLKAYAPKKRFELWKSLGVLPRNIDREVVDIMHRTSIGVDNDPLSLIVQSIKTSLADGWGGSLLATELQDILFGTPQPVKGFADLGVLDEKKVNIIVHGHEPILSEKIVEAAESEEMQKLAKEVGAEGINVCGMCCTGNELLVRHGVPVAGNFLQQELAIITGAVEAMVVDVQCIMPSLPDIAKCYHTKIISTSKQAKFPGAVHIEFNEENADEIAKEIVKTAIENFKNRKKSVHIPNEKKECIVGFSVEAILSALGGSLDALIDAIKSGKIKGAVGIVGCNNPKVKHNYAHVELTKELIKNDILVVQTGCAAIACAEAGLLSLDAIELAGDGLKEVCKALNVPPVLHLGSCVDCSRILVLLGALAEALGVDISDLPVAGAAPEWMSEKAVAIGTYFVASGVFTVLGVVPPILGSKEVVKIATQDAEKLVGGKFAVETDPVKAAKLIIKHIEEKREKLGI